MFEKPPSVVAGRAVRLPAVARRVAAIFDQLAVVARGEDIAILALAGVCEKQLAVVAHHEIVAAAERWPRGADALARSAADQTLRTRALQDHAVEAGNLEAVVAVAGAVQGREAPPVVATLQAPVGADVLANVAGAEIGRASC